MRNIPPELLKRFIELKRAKSLFYVEGQAVIRYANGYGASVITDRSFSCSPQEPPDCFEVAVIKFFSESSENFVLCYATPVTDNVVRRCTPSEVEDILNQIEALPPHVFGR
jgi:hypothetical protein